MLRFVKLVAYYWLDEKVAAGDDAAEVMFTRGMSYCAGAGTAGRIPASIVPTLTRRPTHAARIARSLVERGLWTRAGADYLIAAWGHHNDALDDVEERRRRDRDRKRARRAQTTTVSADSPRTVRGHDPGRPTDVRGTEIEEEVDAAAAAPDAAAAAAPLDPVVDVLRSKLQQHPRLTSLRFDSLTADQVAEISRLVDVHGDARLVRAATDTLRDPAPVHVQAFLRSWQAMPPPGKRLAAVPPPPPPAPTDVHADAARRARAARKGTPS